MATPHRVHVSVFPLGSSEPARALAALREAWVAPAWVSQRQHKGGWLVETLMEAQLPPGEDERAFAERLSVAIWQRLGRYVKVVVDVGADELDTSRRRELGRTDYLKLMRAV